MNRTGMTAVILVLLCGTTQVGAEVYQWRDAEGKVHFADKKPASVDAEDISGSLERTNVEQSGEQRERLNRLFAKETPEELRLDEERQRQKGAAQEKRRRQCVEAKKRLEILRGRVIFSDDKGGFVSVPESERKRRAKEAARWVSQLCSG